MKFKGYIIVIILFIACNTKNIAQSPDSKPSKKELAKALKKEEQKDLDSLYLVHSLPVNVFHKKGSQQLDIEDTLISLLKDKNYKYIDTTAFSQLFQEKWRETLPSNDMAKMQELISKIQADKDYIIKQFRALPAFSQQIQLIFIQKDNGTSYLTIRRFNEPNSIKMREWSFEYSASEPRKQLANRILDTLLGKKLDEK